MRGSSPEDGVHSTPDIGPRPRPWLRVIGSLAIFGFLLGLMVGRLWQPDPQWLREVDEQPDGLVLWFDSEPVPKVEQVAGVYSLRLYSFGRERHGQISVQGHHANWRITREGDDLQLRVVAARPLTGTWRAQSVDGRWKLLVSFVQE